MEEDRIPRASWDYVSPESVLCCLAVEQLNEWGRHVLKSYKYSVKGASAEETREQGKGSKINNVEHVRCGLNTAKPLPSIKQCLTA